MAAVAMFSSRQARIIRMAISPRLATRIFLNIPVSVSLRSFAIHTGYQAKMRAYASIGSGVLSREEGREQPGSSRILAQLPMVQGRDARNSSLAKQTSLVCFQGE